MASTGNLEPLHSAYAQQRHKHEKFDGLITSFRVVCVHHTCYTQRPARPCGCAPAVHSATSLRSDIPLQACCQQDYARIRELLPFILTRSQDCWRLTLQGLYLALALAPAAERPDIQRAALMTLDHADPRVLPGLAAELLVGMSCVLSSPAQVQDSARKLSMRVDAPTFHGSVLVQCAHTLLVTRAGLGSMGESLAAWAACALPLAHLQTQLTSIRQHIACTAQDITPAAMPATSMCCDPALKLPALPLAHGVMLHPWLHTMCTTAAPRPCRWTRAPALVECMVHMPIAEVMRACPAAVRGSGQHRSWPQQAEAAAAAALAMGSKALATLAATHARACTAAAPSAQFLCASEAGLPVLTQPIPWDGGEPPVALRWLFDMRSQLESVVQGYGGAVDRLLAAQQRVLHCMDLAAAVKSLAWTWLHNDARKTLRLAESYMVRLHGTGLKDQGLPAGADMADGFRGHARLGELVAQLVPPDPEPTLAHIVHTPGCHVATWLELAEPRRVHPWHTTTCVSAHVWLSKLLWLLHTGSIQLWSWDKPEHDVWNDDQTGADIGATRSSISHAILHSALQTVLPSALQGPVQNSRVTASLSQLSLSAAAVSGVPSSQRPGAGRPQAAKISMLTQADSDSEDAGDHELPHDVADGGARAALWVSTQDCLPEPAEESAAGDASPIPADDAAREFGALLQAAVTAIDDAQLTPLHGVAAMPPVRAHAQVLQAGAAWLQRDDSPGRRLLDAAALLRLCLLLHTQRNLRVAGAGLALCAAGPSWGWTRLSAVLLGVLSPRFASCSPVMQLEPDTLAIMCLQQWLQELLPELQSAGLHSSAAGACEWLAALLCKLPPVSLAVPVQLSEYDQLTSVRAVFHAPARCLERACLAVARQAEPGLAVPHLLCVWQAGLGAAGVLTIAQVLGQAFDSGADVESWPDQCQIQATAVRSQLVDLAKAAAAVHEALHAHDIKSMLSEGARELSTATGMVARMLGAGIAMWLNALDEPL